MPELRSLWAHAASAFPASSPWHPVSLKDGRVISTPLIWYPRLSKASPADLAVWEWHGDGVCWPLLDEDLSIKGMLEGNPSIEYEREAQRAAAAA